MSRNIARWRLYSIRINGRTNIMGLISNRLPLIPVALHPEERQMDVCFLSHADILPSSLEMWKSNLSTSYSTGSSLRAPRMNAWPNRLAPS